MSLIGKKFVKKTEIIVIDETANALIVQNANDDSGSWHIPKSSFEKNSVEGEDLDEIVDDLIDDLKDGGDMAVSDENNTKEVK